jgi:hypothetical protein
MMSFRQWNSFETKPLRTLKRFSRREILEPRPKESVGLSEKREKISRWIQEMSQKDFKNGFLLCVWSSDISPYSS